MPPRAFHSPDDPAPKPDRPPRDPAARQPGVPALPGFGRPRIDSEARKKRDAKIRSMDEQIADALEQSRRSGELQSAESWGRPMPEMAGYAETPPEFRMPFKILKNADAAPPEVAMFQQRAALREQVAACPPGPEQRALQQRLAELEQALALRLEHLRTTGSR